MRGIILFPLRALNFLIGWWWYWMEIAADLIVGVFAKTQYKRAGSCVRCGQCCRLLALAAPYWIIRREWLTRFVIAWHEAVLNFEFQGIDRNYLVYRCRYFINFENDDAGMPDGQKIDSVKKSDTSPRCKIYPFRHRLCRFYPRPRLYGHPNLPLYCGFSFLKRDGKASFDEILRKYQ